MSQTIFVIVAICAMSVALVTGRPQKHHAQILTAPLESAANNTICPIKVTTNTVEGRIPKHIHMIQCDEQAIESCPATQPDGDCCKRDGMKWRECFQLVEFVPVKFADNITTFKAHVGCACITQEGTSATHIKES